MVVTRSGMHLGNGHAPTTPVHPSPSSNSSEIEEEGDEEGLLSSTGATVGSPASRSNSSMNPDPDQDVEMADAYPTNAHIIADSSSDSLHQSSTPDRGRNEARSPSSSRSPEPGLGRPKRISRRPRTQMALPAPINRTIGREYHAEGGRSAVPAIDQFPVPPNTQGRHTNRRPVVSTTSSFVQDTLAEHNNRVERGEILPFLPGPEPLQPERVRTSPIDWSAIGRSAQKDEVPWSPEGAGSRQTGDSTWDGEQSIPTDKMTGELDNMLNKRKRESSESELEDEQDEKHERKIKRHRRAKSLPRGYRFSSGNDEKRGSRDSGGRGDRDDSNGDGVAV